MSSALQSEAVSVPTDTPRGRLHVRRLVVSALVIGVLWIVVDLFGWDVGKWFDHLWEALTGVSPAYLAAGLALQTVQTICIALAWLAILRYAYPGAPIPFKPVLASYATGVALNGFLPAHIGTFVMMFLLGRVRRPAAPRARARPRGLPWPEWDYAGCGCCGLVRRAPSSSLRELISSFVKTLCICHSTVRLLRNSCAPISGFE